MATPKCTWHCNWQPLGLSAASLPASRYPFISLEEREEEFGHVDLDLVRSVANHVRGFDAKLLADGDAQQAAAVHQDLCRLQRLAHELDPATIQLAIRDMPAGVAQDVPARKSFPYRVAFVVQALLQCDLLKAVLVAHVFRYG